jgi:hypothetical protein
MKSDLRATGRYLLGFGLALYGALSGLAGRADESLPQAIDRLLTAARDRDKVRAVGPADDTEFVRRLYLDLIGRIPTRDEAQHFVADKDPQKRARLIDRLLAGDEFPRHWRENLHVLLMGGPVFAGNAEWRAWLESALRQNQGWDAMARTVLRARSAKPDEAGADQFLVSRFAQGPSGLDLTTRDVSRYFFGVDVQCARCHKHPEVKQWRQESYWGMAAFWNRSYPLAVNGKMYLAERAAGEVEFSGRTGVSKAARPVFLTGDRLAEPPAPAPAPAPKPAAGSAPMMPPEDPTAYLVPPETAPQKTRVPVPKFSRREKLVEMAITASNPYFKRAAVNYVWSQLLGRGLVEPVDQMHDANPASHPELLSFLGDDFAAHRFDLRYLIRGITNSQTYQLTSRYPTGAPRPAEATYSCGAIRPLSSHQLALTLVTAAGYLDTLRSGADAKTHTNPGALRARLETVYAGQLTTLVSQLDSGAESFQPGIRAALFQANSSAFAELIARGGLAARLAGIVDDGKLADEACWCVLSRPPSMEECDRLRAYLRARPDRRQAACEQIVWALLASAEFRFNH